MNSKLTVPFFVLAVTLIAYLVYHFSKKQDVLRTLQKLNFKTNLNFRANEAIAFSGKVKAIETPNIAPLSQYECVAYQLKIEREDRTGKNTYWTTVLDTTIVQTFLVDKAGSLLLIDTNGLAAQNYQCYLKSTKTVTTASSGVKTEEVKRILEQYQMENIKGVTGDKKIKLTEYALRLDTEVTVGGIVNWQSLEKVLPNYNYSKIAALKGTSAQKLLITNVKHGVLNKK